MNRINSFRNRNKRRNGAPQQGRSNPVKNNTNGSLSDVDTTFVLFHKPWGVLSQFTSEGGHPALDQYEMPEGIYPCGRLDRDSEGLLVLTNNGRLQARISSPDAKWPKRYWVQVEGAVNVSAMEELRQGVSLKDGLTAPATVHALGEELDIPPRVPPIRERKNIPTHWLEVILREGRNRQIRRMTAHIGLPTLRLLRASIGPLELSDLEPGQWRQLTPDEVSALWKWRPPT